MEKMPYYAITVRKYNILFRHTEWFHQTQDLYNVPSLLTISFVILPAMELMQGLSAALAADAITLFISSCQKLKGGRTNENSSQGIRQKEN